VVAVTGCDAEFSAFGELDAPVECSAAVREADRDGDPRVTVDLALHQFDKQIATGRVELSPYA
jgi:hypothetical protein